jgi:hypothetical protein
MKVSRRQFLCAAGFGAGALMGLGAGEHVMMERAPRVYRKVIADLHAHPAMPSSIDETRDMLSHGLVGLAGSNSNGYVMRYEQALGVPGSIELETGLLGSHIYEGTRGYFMRAQEVLSDHHILAIGLNENIPDYADARRSVHEIQDRGGLAVLVHPFIISKDDPIFRYGLVDDESKVRELADMVDAIESFNGQCINAIPIKGWLKKANRMAVELCRDSGKEGIASSDTHKLSEQVFTSGIYLDEDDISVERIMDDIRHGRFVRYQQYVSHLSFVRGHFL